MTTILKHLIQIELNKKDWDIKSLIEYFSIKKDSNWKVYTNQSVHNCEEKDMLNYIKSLGN